jgi:two-component system cell cycle sensor histidine kinase/response regulator CckA
VRADIGTVPEMTVIAPSQSFLDAMTDALLIVDCDGKIKQINAEAERRFGYSAAEIIGRSHELLLPEQERESGRVRDAILAVFEAGASRRTIGLDLQCRAGAVIPVELTLTRFEDHAGVRVLASVRDLSREREAQKALRGSSRLLEVCFAHMLTQIVILDPEFNFIRVNEAYAQATGYRVEDFPGKNHFELFPSDAKAIFERVIETGEPFQTHARPFVHPLHPDWGVTYWDWTLVPIFDENGEVELLVFALDEVTERVRAAEELRVKERELAEVKRFEVVGQLAAGIAHDFNNVLTSVLFTLDFLRPQIGEDPANEDIIDDVLDIVQRAKILTYQLLSFGRKQLLRPELVELNQAVRDRAATIRNLIGEACELSIITGETETCFVEVDPGQLDRVLLNLATNAVQAMPEGGKLTIVSAALELDERSANEHPGVEPGSYVVLVVQDEGVGMDEATCARVFEPFFTTKPGERNSGLGLSSVEGIVKQSGGEIFVYSKPGEGTTFKILFPRVSSAESSEGAPPPSRPAEAQPRRNGDSAVVLVVEDEPIIRRLIVEGLRRYGYVVHEASSVDEAWAFLLEHADEVEAVLTDIVLPGSDGLSLAARIEDLYPELPVVIMSGYADSEQSEVATRHSFITKPFAPRDIAALLAKSLRRPTASQVG